MAAERLRELVSQVHRRFIARHQPLVTVGRRIANGAQSAVACLNMPADVIQRHLGQARHIPCRRRAACPSSTEIWWVCMPEPLSPKRGLGMKVTVLPCLRGHVLDDVLVNHHRVGGLDQRVKAEINFRLPGRGHFMVLALDLDARAASITRHISVRMSCWVSAGATGK